MIPRDPNWKKYLITGKTRQGTDGLLELPGEGNGFFCHAYGTDETEAGRKLLDWQCVGNVIWRTEPYSDDLIYSYIYQKTKEETVAFLESVGQKMTIEESLMSDSERNKKRFSERIDSYLRGREIHIAAAFLACVALGGSDG